MTSRTARTNQTPDLRFMRQALELARRGLESVSPNPMVGAVLVRNGKILARGYHRHFGAAHAEIDALRQVRNARGADLYVNLEPCGHRGKTPPCSAEIVERGVRRVFYAAADPNPLTSGRGLRQLRRAGIEVRGGLLRREAAAMNAPYLHFQRSRQPWVLLKWAMSLDGKIATRTGESQWITGSLARAAGHGLRRRVDAILVGTRTALIDDPRLTPRPARGRRPVRVLLDRQGRLPLRLRILRPEAEKDGPRVYVASDRVPSRRLRALERRGLQVHVLPEVEEGLDLRALLRLLGGLGVSQLLVEGGGALAGSFLRAALVNEVAAFVAPRVIGGEAAPSPVAGLGVAHLAKAAKLDHAEQRWLGRDFLIQARVRIAHGQ